MICVLLLSVLCDMRVIVANIIYELLRLKFFTIICHKYGYKVKLFNPSMTLLFKFQLLPRTEGYVQVI